MVPQEALYPCAACEKEAPGLYAEPWHQLPAGWLTLALEEGELVFACSLLCATALWGEEEDPP